MTKTQKKQAEKILEGLGRQPFYDFYVGTNSEFDTYIQNCVYQPKEKDRRKKEMLERIVELFDLK